MRPQLQAFGLATLILLTGCIGPAMSPTSPTPHQTNTSPDNIVRQLETASLWLSGTVARVEANTVYLKQGNDTVVPVTVTNHSALYRCYQVTVMNESGLGCVDKFDLGDMGNLKGEDVCISVEVENSSIHARKAFFNTVCGGPTLPSEASSFTQEQ